MRAFRSRRDTRQGERGQILILFTLVLVILMGLSALVIDVGVLRRANQELWNSLDSGALAGAEELPASGANAEAVARRFATVNFPDIPPGDIGVEFRCVVGDRNNDGLPDSGDIPAVCDPGAGATNSWRCANGICAATCNPNVSTNVCNTIVLVSTVDVDYRFGPAIGVGEGSTGAVLSAACVGPCGASPSVPVDLMMVVDRTSSMSAADIVNLKDATKSVLKIYDPDIQRVGLGILGPSATGASGQCSGANSPGLGRAASSPTGSVTWVPVGLTGVGAPVNERYVNSAGVLNTNSLLVKTIECFNQSSTGTNLNTSMTRNYQYLNANARSGVIKGMIFMTDGQPNGNGDSTVNCANADAAATAAKASGIEVFTVGFGIDSTFMCPDTSGTWNGKAVTHLLASMATGPSTHNGCDAAENQDGDHYFCQPTSGSLSTVFKTAAASLARGTRLISLP